MASKMQWAKYAKHFNKLSSKATLKTLGWYCLGVFGIVKSVTSAFDAGELEEARKLSEAAANCETTEPDANVVISDIEWDD